MEQYARVYVERIATLEEEGKRDQKRIYQIDGQTYSIAVGKPTVVPLWLAQRAKEIGDITDYEIVELVEPKPVDSKLS